MYLLPTSVPYSMINLSHTKSSVSVKFSFDKFLYIKFSFRYKALVWKYDKKRKDKLCSSKSLYVLLKQYREKYGRDDLKKTYNVIHLGCLLQLLSMHDIYIYLYVFFMCRNTMLCSFSGPLPLSSWSERGRTSLSEDWGGQYRWNYICGQYTSEAAVTINGHNLQWIDRSIPILSINIIDHADQR
jgi:hypothetical protein